MVGFIIEWVMVSIAVSILATWIGFVPRYPKWGQTLTLQLINTLLLTMLLSTLLVSRLHPSGVLLFVAMLAVLWLSVRLTGRLFGSRASTAASRPEDPPS
ncbi:MAG TPA: hypothetical protein VMG41_09560 [Gemmatimonadales bacterium]|nr:hypothetical protein [Gemmatimonadales bacterium]